ncbi:MAG: efflux RND transporter periplasmic adaptor subunit [Gammaproteobacteria bacterium]|nr:efflux RND transporter periplasmic adaptor subunit [Gammaproteobacteria bacterium]
MNSAPTTHISSSTAIGAVLLSSFLFAACAEEPAPKPPRPVKAMEISAPSEFTEGSLPGRARAGQEVNLSFRVSGQLQEFPVSVGDKVNTGTSLAMLDPSDFQQLVNSTQSQMQAAQAGFRRAEADYERLLNVQREDPGATSQRAVDFALSARDQARSAVSALEATVQTARDRLSYTELKAPFNSEVAETYVENFQTVVAMQPILRLVDSTSIEMTVSVPENRIGYADYVASITVTFDALPGIEIPASIKEIGREATQATRTFPLTLIMDQPENGEILAGMAGDATFQVRLPESAGRTGITIPAAAAFAGADIKVTNVWVIDGSTNTLSRRQIEVGEVTTSGLLVTSGLEPGEWIVTAGTHSLSDGQEVSIVDSGDAQ